MGCLDKPRKQKLYFSITKPISLPVRFSQSRDFHFAKYRLIILVSQVTESHFIRVHDSPILILLQLENGEGVDFYI